MSPLGVNFGVIFGSDSEVWNESRKLIVSLTLRLKKYKVGFPQSDCQAKTIRCDFILHAV